MSNFINKILIMLSTYDGEKFLKEQLDSLYAQEGVDIHILVRDDGSKDNTITILKKYQNLYGKMTLIEGENIGVIKSFHTLAHYTLLKMPSFDYYSFCDQDDVWLPNKLMIAVNKLNAEDQSNKLYFCRANYVDKKLKFLKKSSKVCYFDYKTSIVRNPALGCTMVFDKKLLKLFILAYSSLDKMLCLHDRWMFLCANYLDAKIINDDKAYILYRQHGRNVTSANKNFILRYLMAFKRIMSRENYYLNNATLFYKTYQNFITLEKKEFLLTLINYNRSILSSIKFLKFHPWKSETRRDKILWSFVVLLRYF